jgi:hypothetical protein
MFPWQPGQVSIADSNGSVHAMREGLKELVRDPDFHPRTTVLFVSLYGFKVVEAESNEKLCGFLFSFCGFLVFRTIVCGFLVFRTIVFDTKKQGLLVVDFFFKGDLGTLGT